MKTKDRQQESKQVQITLPKTMWRKLRSWGLSRGYGKEREQIKEAIRRVLADE